MSDFDDDMDLEEQEEVQSKGELLAHYMGQLNFSPKEPRTPGTLEYVKTYSDPRGRVGRCIIVINKDKVGLEPESIESAVVTFQIHVKPTQEDLEKVCPAMFRPDLQRVMAHFDEPQRRHEAFEVQCVVCSKMTSDFLEKAGNVLCLNCARR